jgi:hypothetical protein
MEQSRQAKLVSCRSLASASAYDHHCGPNYRGDVLESDSQRAMVDTQDEDTDQPQSFAWSNVSFHRTGECRGMREKSATEVSSYMLTGIFRAVHGGPYASDSIQVSRMEI